MAKKKAGVFTKKRGYTLKKGEAFAGPPAPKRTKSGARDKRGGYAKNTRMGRKKGDTPALGKSSDHG